MGVASGEDDQEWDAANAHAAHYLRNSHLMLLVSVGTASTKKKYLRREHEFRVDGPERG
jgi:hypothetical protein